MRPYDFREIFDDTVPNKDHLNVVVLRQPHPVVTTYHFDHVMDVPSGNMRFGVDNDNQLIPVSLLSSPTPAPSDEIVKFAEQLRRVHGLVVSRFMEGISIKSCTITVHKTRAVSDDMFDRDVIAVLAEFFGVELDNVKVAIDNQRHQFFFDPYLELLEER